MEADDFLKTKQKTITIKRHAKDGSWYDDTYVAFKSCNEIVVHVLGCEECSLAVYNYITHLSVSRAGSVSTEAKARAARENGKKGGRPRKKN